MTRYENLTAALLALAIVATPVLVWSAMMYRELQHTGQIIAALS